MLYPRIPLPSMTWSKKWPLIGLYWPRRSNRICLRHFWLNLRKGVWNNFFQYFQRFLREKRTNRRTHFQLYKYRCTMERKFIVWIYGLDVFYGWVIIFPLFLLLQGYNEQENAGNGGFRAQLCQFEPPITQRTAGRIEQFSRSLSKRKWSWVRNLIEDYIFKPLPDFLYPQKHWPFLHRSFEKMEASVPVSFLFSVLLNNPGVRIPPRFFTSAQNFP